VVDPLFAVDLNEFAAHVVLGFVAGLITGLCYCAVTIRWVLREQARQHRDELAARAEEDARREQERLEAEHARRHRTMWD
jgi:hypothetical protein